MKSAAKSINSVCLLTVVLLVLLGSSPAWGVVSKFTAKAGKERGLDSLQFLGLLNATESDVLAASSIVVSLDCADLTSPLEWTFPVNEVSFKSGKYNYARKENASQQLFKLDTKTGKMLFTAKNVDLTGLACPITVTVDVGGYSAEFELDEILVNGPKKPCPAQFLMNVRNSLTVDKASVKLGSKPGSDSMSFKGCFSVAGDYNKSNPLAVGVGGQTLSVPGSQFVTKGYVESCTKGTSDKGPLVKAKFDFGKATYQVDIKNAVIDEVGGSELEINVFGHDLPEQDIDLPSPKCERYELERYRCYDRLGRRWTYSGSYTITDSEDMFSDSGSGTANLQVAGSQVYVNGKPCYSVSTSSGGVTMSTSWYEDYYGTHEYGWGNLDGLFGYEVHIDSVLGIPKLLCVGQTYKDSGTFTGEFDLDLGYGYGVDIDIQDFRGTATSSTTLVGFEPVVVSAGSFTSAAKFESILTIKGTMIMDISYYGEFKRYKASFNATTRQTSWGAENIGVVKADTEMLVKLGVAGESIWVRTTETNSLQSYAP